MASRILSAALVSIYPWHLGEPVWWRVCDWGGRGRLTVALPHGQVAAGALVVGVGAPLVGQHPGHAGVGGGADDGAVDLLGDADAQGHDEGVLAPEGGDEGLGPGVVDGGHGHAGGEGVLVGAVVPGEGRDGVLLGG